MGFGCLAFLFFFFFFFFAFLNNLFSGKKGHIIYLAEKITYTRSPPS